MPTNGKKDFVLRPKLRTVLSVVAKATIETHLLVISRRRNPNRTLSLVTNQNLDQSLEAVKPQFGRFIQCHKFYWSIPLIQRDFKFKLVLVIMAIAQIWNWTVEHFVMFFPSQYGTPQLVMMIILNFYVLIQTWWELTGRNWTVSVKFR